MPRWPRWIDRTDANLREIAPGLYVGSKFAPSVMPPGDTMWGLVVDACGSSLDPSWEHKYLLAREVVAMPFSDGDPIPAGALDVVAPLVERTLAINEPVLVHCAAGLSRSASIGYALLRRMHGLGHEDALARVYAGDPNYPLLPTLNSARAWARRT